MRDNVDHHMERKVRMAYEPSGLLGSDAYPHTNPLQQPNSADLCFLNRHKGEEGGDLV